LFKVVNKTTKKGHTSLATSVTLVTWVQVPIPHKRSESGFQQSLGFYNCRDTTMIYETLYRKL
jgi:hypothetical protein